MISVLLDNFDKLTRSFLQMWFFLHQPTIDDACLEYRLDSRYPAFGFGFSTSRVPNANTYMNLDARHILCVFNDEASFNENLRTLMVNEVQRNVICGFWSDIKAFSSLCKSNLSRKQRKQDE